MADPIRYRKDNESKRRRVVINEGHEGFIGRWVDSCTGCHASGDGCIYDWDPKTKCELGWGCDECGYTGKVRHAMWIPFDVAAWMKHVDDNEGCSNASSSGLGAVRY